MNRTSRLVVTGLAAAGVLATGGVAVAAGFGGTSTASSVSVASVAELRGQLAALQSETTTLRLETDRAAAALDAARTAKAARESAARTARPAAPVPGRTTSTRTPTPARTTAKAPAKAPASHVTTGASGSSAGAENESEGGQDD